MDKKKLNECLKDEFGVVFSVDTKKITVKIEKEEYLNTLKINDIVVFSGIHAEQKLIGIISRVTKKFIDIEDTEDISEENYYSENFAVISLVGTFYESFEGKIKQFKRTINTYPEINSKVYFATPEALTIIMESLSSSGEKTTNLKIGHFVSNEDVSAILDGNKFFQRHAVIVGSTGSGKSFTVANILEKIKELEYGNVIVFDLHGEYNKLTYTKQIKIGSSKDQLHIPLWFFNYEEIHSLFIESSEGTSANQRATVIEFILKQKKEYIEKNLKDYNLDIVTVDTPIPFAVSELIKFLNFKNTEEISTGETYKTGEKTGLEKTKQGASYNKLTNLINRLQTKKDDKKYAFVFSDEEYNYKKYLNKFIHELLDNDSNRVKIIDLSEVPSDILPIVIGIITRLINDVQFWMTPLEDQTRHPLSLICDEAHIYMPNDSSKLRSIDKKSLEIFENIAKEGRKYGLGLVIVSQRPSELNTTIISQCNNIISLKVINDKDKSAIANMLTDSLVGLVDLLPNLDVGECVVVGDAIMLPSKIKLDKPREEPRSTTIDFWDRWGDKDKTVFEIDNAIKNMINQSR